MCCQFGSNCFFQSNTLRQFPRTSFKLCRDQYQIRDLSFWVIACQSISCFFDDCGCVFQTNHFVMKSRRTTCVFWHIKHFLLPLTFYEPDLKNIWKIECGEQTEYCCTLGCIVPPLTRNSVKSDPKLGHARQIQSSGRHFVFQALGEKLGKGQTSLKESPAQVRDMLGQNLRQLLGANHSVTAVCRDIGLHRSQFNRFLNGQAFPKPDVLQRICKYFNTDARILLQPLSSFDSSTQIGTDKVSIGIHPEVHDYFPFSSGEKHTEIMPCGFYRYYRHSYIHRDLYQSAIVYVYMRNGLKFYKGFMHRHLARELNLRVNSAADREFRGSVMGTDTGIFLYAAQRGSRSLTVNYLELRTTVDKSFLSGYCARTMSQVDGIPRVCKTVFEKLPDELRYVRKAAREAGLMTIDELPLIYRDELTTI